jgi:uncharacterized protein (TIGR02266 family)
MSEPNDKAPRAPTNLRIKFRSANVEQFIERYSVDVSRGGIFIRTREPLPVGSRLKLEFQLLDAAPLLSGEGTVTWIRAADPARADLTPGMAVRFDKLTPNSQATLDKILAEKAAREQRGASMAGSGGEMAVRRGSGVSPAPDAREGVPAPVSPSADQTAPGPSGGSEFSPPAIPTPPVRPTSSGRGLAARIAGVTEGGPGRLRTGAGTGVRQAPAPSALFEPPTADDIDRALETLREDSAPPPIARSSASPPADRTPGAVPTDISSSASVGQRAVLHGVLDDRSSPGAGVAAAADDPSGAMPAEAEPSNAAEPAAGSAAAALPETPDARAISAAALDLPVPSTDGDVRTEAGKPAFAPSPVAPERTTRFRLASRPYPTLKKRSFTGIAIVALLVIAAGVGVVKLHLKDRLSSAPPPTPSAEVPSPSNSTAGPSAPTAAANPPAAEPAATASPAAPAPAAEADAALQPKAAALPAPSAPPPGDVHQPATTAGAEGEQRPTGSRHTHKRSMAGAEGATGSETQPTQATTPAARPRPATNGALASERAATDKPADSAQPTAAVPAAPILKVASTPAGAEVLIDGTSVGTTPFVSKDVDASSAHAIAVKKDGYETTERTVGAADWLPAHGNAPQSLKVTVKLRRAAPAASPATEGPPPAGDTGGPYIKEVSPSSP